MKCEGTGAALVLGRSVVWASLAGGSWRWKARFLGLCFDAWWGGLRSGFLWGHARTGKGVQAVNVGGRVVSGSHAVV